MSNSVDATTGSEEDSKQIPVQLSLCRSLCRQFHWKCFVLTALVDGCLVAIVWCKLNLSSIYQISTSPAGGSHGIVQFQTSATGSSGIANGFFDGLRRTGAVGGNSGSSSLAAVAIQASPLISSSSSSGSSSGASASSYQPLYSSSGGSVVGGGGIMGGGGACDDGYIYIPAAFVLMMYIVYLVECWHCRLREELDDRLDPAAVYDLIRRLNDAAPIVWWRAVCYHYVRRTRQVARYRNGDAFTATQVYYERINSHVTSSAYDYSEAGVRDVSRRLVDLEKCPCARVRLTKRFSFATAEAERGYERQRAAFFGEHERRDDYVETREGVDFDGVDDYRDRILVYADPDRPPWYLSPFVYWSASAVLLSWPLRILVQYRTAYVHYYVHKVFGGGGAQTTTGPLMTSLSAEGDIIRVTSGDGCGDFYDYEGDAASLESTIQTNSAVVPSYSEAMSMDRVGRGPGDQTNRRWDPLLHSTRPTSGGAARRTVYGSIVSSDGRRAFVRSTNSTSATSNVGGFSRFSGFAGASGTTPSQYQSAFGEETNGIGFEVQNHFWSTFVENDSTTENSMTANRKRKRRRRSYHEAVSDPIGSRSSLAVFGRRRHGRRRGEVDGDQRHQTRRNSDVGVPHSTSQPERFDGRDDNWIDRAGLHQLRSTRSCGGGGNSGTSCNLDSIQVEGSIDAVSDTGGRSFSDRIIGDEAGTISRQPSAFTAVTAASSDHDQPLAAENRVPASYSSEVGTAATNVPSSNAGLFNDATNRAEPSNAAVEIPDDDDSPPPYEVALRMRVMPSSLNPSAVFRNEFHFRPIVDDTSSISTVSTYLSADPGDQQLTPRHRATACGGMGWKFSPFRQSPVAVLAAAFPGVSSVTSSSRRSSASTRTAGLIPLQTYHVETSL